MIHPSNNVVEIEMRLNSQARIGIFTGVCLRNLARVVVPADLTLASDLAFVFNTSRVRPECCVDPLSRHGLPDKSFWADFTCTVMAFIGSWGNQGRCMHEYVGSDSYFDGRLGYGVTCTLPLG